MAKFPVPETNVEWPEWEYRPFPRWVGRDVDGADLIAKDESEVKDLEKRKVYPKVLGKNRDGNDIIALDATEEQLKKSQVDPEKSKTETKPSKPGKE